MASKIYWFYGHLSYKFFFAKDRFKEFQRLSKIIFLVLVDILIEAVYVILHAHKPVRYYTTINHLVSQTFDCRKYLRLLLIFALIISMAKVQVVQ